MRNRQVRRHPFIYEANALIFLRRLSSKYSRELTLSTIPDDEWLKLAQMGFDFVWLMGVWERSKASRLEALSISGLREEYTKALPDWADEDVVGSPYAIHSYTLDPALGERAELAELKARLNRLGLLLMLDFVPNHVAIDHAWVSSHPDWFIIGDEASLTQNPSWFYSSDGNISIAHGKDPYFPPWTDTAQLNYYSREMRDALAEELLNIVEVSDGVRCDMSMLVMNSVFEQTWGWALRERSLPASEFWPDTIKKAKRKNEKFVFLGEAYWGLGPQLQQMGFDYTYDKTLYDRLVESNPVSVRDHIGAEQVNHNRFARFIENHDEPRASAAFGRERSRAAAVVVSTIPGLRLLHDGQLEGKSIKLPVQLGREPFEKDDSETRQFYERLLDVCNNRAFHDAEWRLLDIGAAWDGNESYRSLLAWSWQHEGEITLVVVNYSSHSAQGRVKIKLPAKSNNHIFDKLNGETYPINYDEAANLGLYVDLAPWNSHIITQG